MTTTAPEAGPNEGALCIEQALAFVFSWATTAAKRGFFATCALVILASAASAAGLATPPITSALPAFASPSTDISLGETLLDAESEDALDDDDALESGWDSDLLPTKAVTQLSSRGSQAMAAAASDEESPGRAVSLGLFRPPQV